MSSPTGSQAGSAYTEPRPVSDTEALANFRQLEALRSGDLAKLQPFLNALTRTHSVDDGAALLGRAVKCASYETVEVILANRAVDPNAPYPVLSGTTPLHLAAELGRADVVRLLLDQPTINDTLVDGQGLTCIETAISQDVLDIILQSRTRYQGHYLATLSEYTTSPDVKPGSPPSAPYAELLRILSSPRSAVLDVNALDPTSGSSLLHEAVRRRDLKLLQLLCLERGADVFVRDKRGKRVFDGERVGYGHSGHSDDVTNLLKQAANNQKSVVQGRNEKPHPQRGYLMKYTNVAHGYKPRWFVLKDGDLSYFRNQEEEGRACRGSVALKYAMLKPTSSTRFDIQSVGHDSRFPKWNLQASHPQEMANWSQAIRQHIEYYKDGGVLAQSTAAAAAAGGDKATLSVSTRRPSSTLTRSNSLSSNALFAAASAAGASLTPIAQEASPLAVPSGSSAAAAAALRSVRKSPSTISLDDAGTIDGDADEDEDDVRKVSHLHLAGLPHEDKYEVHAQTVKAQLEVADQLLDALVATGGGPIVPSHLPAASSTSSSQREPSVSSQQSSSLKRSPSTSSSSRQQSVKDSLRQSLKALSDLLTEYQGMSADREQWLIERYQHEVTTRLLWEQSMQETARQHADMERVLHEAAEKNSAQRKELRAVRMSTIHAASPLTTPTRESVAAGALMAGAMLAAPTSIGAVIGSPTVTASSGKDLPAMPVTPVVPVGGTPTVAMSASPVDPSDPEVTIELPKVVRSGFIQTPIPSVSTPQEDEEEEEDEFFDAVESGTLPLQIAESILHPVVTDLEAVFEEAEKQPTTIRGVELNRADYEPYGHLRSRLPINSDARPAVSLWAILKSSIGKDLTKISFPVFFNEPTSMLERMAEDMEFSECLDAAAADRDSLKRLAYVAAFAMSNYSSTEGRIAKPFNPMLGETYEYCRLDKKFRYVSEQVSHHPPISACWAESPKWRYYGEVDAKNKFLGRSFEIRPTGLAHVQLRIPKSWVSPEAGYAVDTTGTSPEGEELVLEHYSWKKVTTAVSGFITASPIIDHYGDMEVKNHRTGETCVLSFKARGWRAKDACEIKGVVKDAEDRIAWDIAGRWNSQLVARKVGAGHGLLEPDGEMPSRGETEYILLWKNTAKPPAPFNLTPFAITLNDIPQGLDRLLPPTDCRIRPDQRNFEAANYDRANELKQAQEAKQRETRRKRELGQLPPHAPRWFARALDKDTGEQYWEPSRAAPSEKDADGVGGHVEYWEERSRVAREGGKWSGVEEIFVKEDEI